MGKGETGLRGIRGLTKIHDPNVLLPLIEGGRCPQSAGRGVNPFTEIVLVRTTSYQHHTKRK